MNEKLMCIYIISSKACVSEIHVVYLKKSITFTNSNLIFDLRSGLRLRLPSFMWLFTKQSILGISLECVFNIMRINALN